MGESMQQQELTDLMKQMHDDFIRYAADELDLTLDGSEASIASLTEAVERIKQQLGIEVSDNKVAFTLSNLLGGYAGEIYRNHVGGQWLYEENDGKPTVYLVDGEASYAFHGIAYQNLMGSDEVLLADYYEHAKSQHQQNA
jgi:hypothetical protein